MNRYLGYKLRVSVSIYHAYFKSISTYLWLMLLHVHKERTDALDLEEAMCRGHFRLLENK